MRTAFLIVIATGCTHEPRPIDASATIETCGAGGPTACRDALFADAAYTGGTRAEDDTVAEALLLLLDTPDWYEAALGELFEVMPAMDYGDAVATARGRRVTLNSPATWPVEAIAAALVHESAHAARPVGARHRRCDGQSVEGDCDNGEPGDGYVMVADWIAEGGAAAGDRDVLELLHREAVARSW